MSIGDTINQSGNFQIGVTKESVINLSANQSFEQHIKDMVKKIDKSDAPDNEKIEAKSRLKEFLKHPLTIKILGGLLSI